MHISTDKQIGVMTDASRRKSWTHRDTKELTKEPLKG